MATETDWGDWVTDEHDLDPRFPLYTRANADEVGPEPISPLGWTLVFALGVNPGGLQSWIRMGVLSDSERRYDPRGTAIFGGYLFNNMSLARVFGARMPGGDVEQLDRQSFGDRADTPPYEPHLDDLDPDRTAALGQYLADVMAAGPLPAIDELCQQARGRRRARPDYTQLGDDELLAAVRAVAPAVEAIWRLYIYISVASSVGPGAVTAIGESIGRPDLSSRLISGIGDVVSAQAPRACWALARTVAASTPLTAQFDRGVTGLRDRLDAEPSQDAPRFLRAFDQFLDEHGHRGPNEWDMRSTAWEEDPDAVLAVVDLLRHQDVDHDPESAGRRATVERDRLVADVEAELGPEGSAALHAAVQAAHVWLSRREAAKDACVRFIHESHLAALELGRRLATDGALAAPDHIFMVTEAELDDVVARRVELAAETASRAGRLLALSEREPPYFIDVRVSLPPPSTWPRREGSKGWPAALGDVLTGHAGAPGVATGRARVVLASESFTDLAPTDIAVVRSTDPSWTPLFLSVAGVVSERGATISHAAIVCRELGIPCVVSCEGATDRIADGMIIAIDGATGLVTIVAAGSV